MPGYWISCSSLSLSYSGCQLASQRQTGWIGKNDQEEHYFNSISIITWGRLHVCAALTVSFLLPIWVTQNKWQEVLNEKALNISRRHMGKGLHCHWNLKMELRPHLLSKRQLFQRVSLSESNNKLRQESDWITQIKFLALWYRCSVGQSITLRGWPIVKDRLSGYVIRHCLRLTDLYGPTARLPPVLSHSRFL